MTACKRARPFVGWFVARCDDGFGGDRASDRSSATGCTGTCSSTRIDGAKAHIWPFPQPPRPVITEPGLAGVPQPKPVSIRPPKRRPQHPGHFCETKLL